MSTVPRQRYEAKLATLRKQEQEEARLTARLEEVQRELAEQRNESERRIAAKQASLREAQDQREQAETRLKAAQARLSVIQAAQRAHLYDPDDATRLIDLESIRTPEDADRAVRQLTEQKPHLARPRERGHLAKLGIPLPGGPDARDDAEQALRAVRDAFNAPKDPLAPSA